MRCTRCKAKVPPGPQMCPSCDGPLELTFGDIARWTLIGTIRRLRAGGAPLFIGLAVGVAALAGGVFFLGGSSDGEMADDEPVSTIAQLRPVPEAAVSIAPEAPAPAPAPVEPWLQMLGSGDAETAVAVDRSRTGQFVFVGRSQNPDFPALSDALFVRTDEAGVVLSQTVLGGLGQSGASDVSIGTDGAIYAVGRDGASLSVVRLDERGDMLWGAAFPAGDAVIEPVAAAISNSGVVAAAVGEAPGTLLVVRLDQTGREVWRSVILADGLAGALSVDAAPSGGAYLSFAARDIGGEAATPQVLSLDKDGEKLWRHEFAERAGQSLAAISATPDGVVYVAGGVPVKEAPDTATPWLARLSGDGEVDWEADLEADAIYPPLTLDAAATHGVHLAAAAPSGDGGGSDIWVARIGRDGGLVWDTALASPVDEGVRDITVTPEGDIVLAGRVHSAPAEPSDMLMLRLSKGGVPPLGLSDATAATDASEPVESAADLPPAALEGVTPVEPQDDAGVIEVSAGDATPTPAARSADADDLSPIPLTAVGPPADGGSPPDIPAPVEVEPVVIDTPPAETGEVVAEELAVEEPAGLQTADAGDAAESAEEPAQTGYTHACVFRCKTTTPDAVKYPVSRTYRGQSVADSGLFALDVQADAAGVCEASGGVRVDDTPPSCN